MSWIQKGSSYVNSSGGWVLDTQGAGPGDAFLYPAQDVPVGQYGLRLSELLNNPVLPIAGVVPPLTPAPAVLYTDPAGTSAQWGTPVDTAGQPFSFWLEYNGSQILGYCKFFLGTIPNGSQFYSVAHGIPGNIYTNNLILALLPITKNGGVGWFGPTDINYGIGDAANRIDCDDTTLRVWRTNTTGAISAAGLIVYRK